MSLDITPPTEALTRRELEVVQLVARGLANAEIAQRLTLETGTVANHLQRIMRKLDVQTRVLVATWAVAHARDIREERLLMVLERLRDIHATSLPGALTEVAQRLAELFGADKVDVFLVNVRGEVLVALGTSPTAMGAQQHALGLDILPLARGGRVAHVFRTKQPFRSGQLDQDPEELRGIKEDLGVRSTAAVPLALLDQPLGVLSVSSAEPERFSARDLDVLAFVAHWLSLVAIDADVATKEP